MLGATNGRASTDHHTGDRIIVSPRHKARTKGQQKARSLFWRLLVGVNVVLMLILGLFALWDYRSTADALFREKRTALQEEAKTLLPGIERLQAHGREPVQRYIDQVCGEMQDAASPGHHIAVRIGSNVFQAHAHHRASPALFAAMEEGARSADGRGRADGRSVIAGSARQGQITVYVSEYVENLNEILQRTMLRRALALVAAGVLLAAFLNIVLHRFLLRPLSAMVGSVHAFAAGDRSVRMPPARSRELGILANEFDRMAEALQRVEEARRRSMARAQQIQQNLLPDVRQLPGLKLACVFEPAAEVAGDYYDALPLPDGSVMLCVADVTGHDVPAAMGAAMLKALVQVRAAHAPDPAGLLNFLDEAYSKVSLSEDFATMAILHYDPAARRLLYASAGHEPVVLLHARGETTPLEATGIPLGVMGGGEWQTEEIVLAPQDRIVVFTDGLPEMRSQNGEMFGRERVAQWLEESRSVAMEDAADALRQRIRAYRGSQPPQDDITVFIAEAQ